jgi:thioredoxin-related protein
MKLKKAVLLLVILIAGVFSALAASETIDWQTYEAGMARSRFEKKAVFLYFYAEWCTYCVEMERKTFKDPAVVSALNRIFVPIRVDADRNPAASSLYKIKGLPDCWFLSETGEVIGHRPGFIPAEQLLKILNAISSGEAGK